MRARDLLIGLAIGCSGATGRAETRPAHGGTVEAALASAPVALDPLSPAPADRELAALVYDTPFRLDASGQPRPHLALALDPPPPGEPLQAARARLKLRADVRFHDGRPLKAADVAASLQRAIAAPEGWMLAPLRAARAIADDTVELELSRPAPDLALLLATPAASVTPGGARPGPKPVGSGPFAVERVQAGDQPWVRLQANGACFAGRPYLDTVTLRSFQQRADETQRYDLGALAAARHLGTFARRSLVDDSPIAITTWLAVGKQVPDELAAALKAALPLAIDRERLRRHVREPSKAAAGAAYDPEQARARLQPRLAGRDPNARLSLAFDRSRPDDRAIAERLLVELGKIGLDLTLEPLDATSYQARLLARDYALLLGESAPPAPGLGELAMLAAVDAAAARAVLARAPAQAAPRELESARVVPLLDRAARLTHAPSLRGLRLDLAGRASWADAHLRGGTP